MADLEIEVVYALPDRQELVRLRVPTGTSVRQAAVMSGVAEQFPGLDIATARLGIFGKAVGRPEESLLEAGDRVEIYRPLSADPKEVRKQRAARAARAKTEQTLETR